MTVSPMARSGCLRRRDGPTGRWLRSHGGSPSPALALWPSPWPWPWPWPSPSPSPWPLAPALAFALALTLALSPSLALALVAHLCCARVCRRQSHSIVRGSHFSATHGACVSVCAQAGSTGGLDLSSAHGLHARLDQPQWTLLCLAVIAAVAAPTTPTRFCLPPQLPTFQQPVPASSFQLQRSAFGVSFPRLPPCRCHAAAIPPPPCHHAPPPPPCRRRLTVASGTLFAPRAGDRPDLRQALQPDLLHRPAPSGPPRAPRLCGAPQPLTRLSFCSALLYL